MKRLGILLIFLLPISCNSEDLVCKYERSFVDEVVPVIENIKDARWTKDTDKDSGEYISRLHINYNSKNTAIVEHKYCDIYNFEYTYSFNDSSIKPSKEMLAKQSAIAFNLSKIKPSLKTNLEQIVLNELSQQAFVPDTPLSIGLPVEQVTYNDNVEYGIEYSPAVAGQAVASLIFYISIGGQ